MWSCFSSSTCGDMPNTQNAPYRACSGCLSGGGSEGLRVGHQYGKGDAVSWLTSGGSRVANVRGVVRGLTGHDEGGSTFLVALNKAGCDKEGYYPPHHHISLFESTREPIIACVVGGSCGRGETCPYRCVSHLQQVTEAWEGANTRNVT